jgi:pentatricopeptide repeat protein
MAAQPAPADRADSVVGLLGELPPRESLDLFRATLKRRGEPTLVECNAVLAQLGIGSSTSHQNKQRAQSRSDGGDDDARERELLLREADGVFEQMLTDPPLWPSVEPDTWTFSTMIAAHAGAGDAARAEEIFAEMLSRGVPPDAHTFSSLITAHGNASDDAQSGGIARAEELFGAMGPANTWVRLRVLVSDVRVPRVVYLKAPRHQAEQAGRA